MSGEGQTMQRGGEKGFNEEDKLNQLIREAENAKTKMFQTPGKKSTNARDNSRNLMHAVIADDNYLVLGAHLDEHITEKIVNGDYIDLAKLLPKDRILALHNEGQKLHFMIKNGQSFWVPPNEHININSYQRWEQAFRIYADVYSRAHPHRSSELIQYGHIINTISAQYIWENVYDYDKDFRLHMARHTDRS